MREHNNEPEGRASGKNLAFDDLIKNDHKANQYQNSKICDLFFIQLWV
jgi:hypothetical protein